MTSPRKTPAGKIGRAQWIAIIVLLLAGGIAGFAILRTPPPKAASGHDHGGHGDHGGHDEKTADKGHADEAPEKGHGHAHEAGGHDDHEEEAPAQKKGPHGGMLFAEGDFGLELLLAEANGEARFKAWLLDAAGKPAAPQSAKVTVQLARPGGVEEEHLLVADKDGSLTSAQPVAEPHVFEATIAAQTAKEPYLFTYSAQEGVVRMPDAQVKAAGITLEAATAQPIRSTLQLPGEIRFNEDRTAHVVPRVGGVVDQVSANIGQQVRKGQVLAVLSSAGVSESRSELRTAQQRLALARTTHEREKALWEEKISPQQDLLQARQALHEAEIAVANATQKLAAIGAGNAAAPGALGRYELRAPFDGMVVEKHLALGESVKEDSNVFTISDLSSVWAELSIGAKDLPQVRVGEKVTVRATAFDAQADGTVSFVGALIGEQTRTAKARVTLTNPALTWRPGLFVNVDLVGPDTAVPVTVSTDALHTLGDQSVVFVKVPGGFVAQPVKPGRADGRRVEIVSGLKPGVQHAAAGSFIVKAEQGKGSATHSH